MSKRSNAVDLVRRESGVGVGRVLAEAAPDEVAICSRYRFGDADHARICAELEARREIS